MKSITTVKPAVYRQLSILLVFILLFTCAGFAQEAADEHSSKDAGTIHIRNRAVLGDNGESGLTLKSLVVKDGTVLFDVDLTVGAVAGTEDLCLELGLGSKTINRFLPDTVTMQIKAIPQDSAAYAVFSIDL